MNLSLTYDNVSHSVGGFVKAAALQPADVLVIRARQGALVDHFAVYLGWHNGSHMFAAAVRDGGVRVMDEAYIRSYGSGYQVTEVRQFPGGKDARRAALVRAKEMMGRPYNLLFANCEHFANYVFYGTNSSSQSKNAAAWVAGGGALLALSSNNKAARALGAAAALGGLYVLVRNLFNE